MDSCRPLRDRGQGESETHVLLLICDCAAWRVCSNRKYQETEPGSQETDTKQSVSEKHFVDKPLQACIQ